MGRIKLSIIIPLYNGKKYIEETIDTVLKIKTQKEIIIVDDGSTDGSYEFCKKIWDSNPSIRIYTKKNGGIVDARNFGLKRASGSYVLFVDQDDVVFAEVIERAVFDAFADNIDCVIWSTVRLLNDGSTIPCDIVYDCCCVDKKNINEILIPSMLIDRSNNIVSYLGHIWAGIYKLDAIKKNNIVFKKFVDIEDDYLFVFDVLNRIERVLFINEVGYAWRFNKESETFRLKYIEGILWKYNELYNYLRKSIDRLEVNQNTVDEFSMYSIQNSVVMSIENSYTCINKSSKDKKEIKEYYKTHQSVFCEGSIATYNKRRKRIYWFLEHKIYHVACIYVYLDSVYRKIRANRK